MIRKLRRGCRLEGPAHTAASVFIDEGIVGYDTSSMGVELKRHFVDAQFGHCFTHAGLGFLFAVEKQKTAAACPGDFSAQRAVLSRQTVSFVNHGIGDLLGNFLFGFPAGVKQRTKFPQIAVTEASLASPRPGHGSRA